VSDVTLTSPSINLTGLTIPYLQFDWFKNNGDPSATKINNNLKVEGNNGSGWVTLFNDTSNSTAWRTVGITLPSSFVNTTAQFRFVVDKTLSSNFYDDLLLDSVKVISAPTCFPPSGLAVSSITSSSVAITWTAPSSAPSSGYEWEVRTSGTPGSGATGLAASGSTAAGVTSASVTNLQSNTSYTFYVRSNCGTTNGSSTWASGTSFTTLCAAATLPFVENFSTTFPPSCWTMAKGFLTSTPSALVSSTSTGWGADKYLNNAANGDAARVNVFSNTKRDWLITPSIDLGTTAGNYVLEFNLGVVAYSTSTTVTSPTGTTLGSDDTVAVVVSTNNGATWSSANAVRVWTAANTPISSTGSQRYYIPLNNYSGQIKIGFYASEGTVDDLPDNDIFIDSVAVTTCIKPVVNLGNDTTLCNGSTLTLNGGSGATTYQWMMGGSTTPVATTATYSVTAAGTYYVQASTANPGCFSGDTIVVTGAAVPVVNIGPDTAFCSGNSVTLNAGNAGASYLWSTGAITQSVNASTSGSYNVRVTNAAGCIDRDTVVVTVNPLPVVNLGADTAFCSGGSKVLNAGNAGSTYLWSTGATTQSITATTSGSYNVRVTNASGCIARDTVVITVNPLPVVYLGNDTSFCAPAAITLNAGNAGSSYLWSTQATTQTISASTSGSYSVRVTSPAGCVARDTINVTVRPQPVAGTINVTGSSPTFTFGSTGTQTTMFRVWNFGDNSTPDSTTAPTHTYTQNGTYTVTLYAVDSCGVDSTTATVQVVGLGVGGTVTTTADVHLFPNPANNTVFVENMSTRKMGVITILNAVGAVVAEKTASGTREQIDLSSLPAGSYLVRIQMDGTTAVRRMQIVK
jgi:PKD repeat protein